MAQTYGFFVLVECVHIPNTVHFGSCQIVCSHSNENGGEAFQCTSLDLLLAT